MSERAEATAETNSQIVELRQYTLHPGARETLIELFDREFVETQEDVGMRVIGQFRELGDPNRFVWFRGFADMPARAEGLEAFYGGPVWKKHRDAANATMIDSDDVLLLRPARPTSGFPLASHDRPAPGATDIPKGIVLTTTYHLDGPADEFCDYFERALKPILIGTSAQLVAYYVSETSPNNFPALPVREGENVFVSVSCFPDRAAFEYHRAALAQSRNWRREEKALALRVKGDPGVLKLSPTARSQLRG